MLRIFQGNTKQKYKGDDHFVADYKSKYKGNAKDFERKCKAKCKGDAEVFEGNTKQNTKGMHLFLANYKA